MAIPISKMQTEESTEQITWYLQQNKKHSNNSNNNLKERKMKEL